MGARPYTLAEASKLGNRFDGRLLQYKGFEFYVLHTLIGGQTKFQYISKRLDWGLRVEYRQFDHNELYNYLKEVDKYNKSKGVKTKYGSADILLLKHKDGKYYPVIPTSGAFGYYHMDK